MTQMDLDDDDDSGGEQPLYIKEDDEEEPIKEEEASMDSTGRNDTRLSDLHNTTLKTENESEEDKPLVKIVFCSQRRSTTFGYYFLLFPLFYFHFYYVSRFYLFFYHFSIIFYFFIYFLSTLALIYNYYSVEYTFNIVCEI